MNLYKESVPSATAFNIRTCATAECTAGSQIDDYQYASVSS